MYLSKLSINVYSREFRRDHADIRQMHRTVMSGYPDLADKEVPARRAQGVLWRLDGVRGGFIQYVQSNVEPDWSRLPAGYLSGPAQVRSLQPVLDAIAPGRRFAFRLVANPTRAIPRRDQDKQEQEDDTEPKRRTQNMKVALRDPIKQVDWLIRKGGQHGFVIPATGAGQPDVTTSPCPDMIGQKEKPKNNKDRITVVPVRFEGFLVVTDAAAFADAVRNGIGRGKAYGCGLISLAPARTGL